MNVIKRILILSVLFSALSLRAAEFEVMDKFSVNNYSEFRGSVAVITEDLTSPILWISTSGAAMPVVYVSTSGKVGIGTDAPTHKLHVVGESTFTGNAFFGSSITVSAIGGLSAPLTDDSAATKAYVDAALDTCALGVGTVADIRVGASADINCDNAAELGTLPTRTLEVSTDAVTFGVYVSTWLSLVDTDLVAGNIRSGYNIFGKVGVFTSGATAVAGDILSGKTAGVNGAIITGALATQALDPANDTVLAGNYAATTLSAVDADLAAGNIAVSTTIFGKVGTYTSDANATAANILSGQTAYVNGVKITGTVPAGANVSGGNGLKTFTITDGLYSGSKTATANDTLLVAGNIKTGVTVFGITGTYANAPPAPAVGGTWLLVPGDTSLGTRDFYVQKYEAKNVGGVPTSQASGAPWASISQTNAKRYCTALGPGYHLLTMEEAQTISRNIENIDWNWTGGSVGSGGLWRGHSDNSPASALAADITGDPDDDPYVGTGQSSPSIEKRIHQLSTGQYIWDWSGNVWEWVDMTCIGGTGIGLWDTPAAWQEWTDAPLADYEKSRAGPEGAYTSVQNTGQYYGCTATANAVSRGSSWSYIATAGVFAFNANVAPSGVLTYFGFRCGR